MENKRLTELTKTSGWAAKVPPDILSQVLRGLPKTFDENLIVGIETSDDAAVYKINDDLAMIATLDFFTPVVDDPYTFGQIAATNSLSDVYAMGGEPKIAMNIMCFPNCLDPMVMKEILRGGYDKVIEAGALIVGGHTVQDDEPKYGLSIVGFVHPDKVWANNTAKVGDVLILTKPIGMGVVNTAIKAQMADEETYKDAVRIMTTLNKYAKEALFKVGGVNSLTDITGFGLAGHALEMAEGSGVSITIDTKDIEYAHGAVELAKMGLVPAGAYDNRIFCDGNFEIKEGLPIHVEDLVFDPQTSGGLMASVSPDKMDEIMEELGKLDIPSYICGRVEEKKDKFIYIIWGDMMDKGKLYASIPKVDDFINNSDFMKSLSDVPRKVIMDQIRKNLDGIRTSISVGNSEKEIIEKINNIKENTLKDIISYNDYRLKTVINAAGVVIHTNLGRSLLNEEVMDHVHKSLSHYSNLEYDLIEGKRGSRYDILTDVIRDITGAEDVLVVNNNAAAVMLALSTIAKDKEVILSRGEMVEIGGAFRVPEVLESSGASLVAIGTTNKTKLSDYENAITEDTAALLKVHTSNYRIVGFTESVDAEDLKPLKEKYNIPIIEDLGSGVLIDLSKYGIEKEPSVQDSIKKGIDIVTFSGDKLLGGPQAGIIIGKKKYIEQMKKNPLTRALRVDKFTLSALEATMKYYYNLEEAVEKIPTLKMITVTKDKIIERIKSFMLRLKDIKKAEISIVDSLSEVGGGSLPTEKLLSASLCLNLKDRSPDSFEKALRTYKVPIIARIQEEKVLFDFRTIQDDELDILEDGIRFALNYNGEWYETYNSWNCRTHRPWKNNFN